MENANVRKSAPWVSYVHRLQALFGGDPDIKVEYDGDDQSVALYVHGSAKAEALNALLPTKAVFGSVELEIAVVPDNAKTSVADLMHSAFSGNPLYSRVITVRPEGCSNPISYVMFMPEVVQYWDDNLGDPNGLESTLAQELAEELLDSSGGVCYCTEDDR